MSIQNAVPQPETKGRSELGRTPSGPPSSGPFLLTRGLWLVMALAVLTLVVLGLPPLYAQLSTVSPTTTYDTMHLYLQLSAADAHALQTLGVSLNFYAVYRSALQLLLTLGFLATAAVLFWRKPDLRLALFTSFTLLVFATNLSRPVLDALTASAPAFTAPMALLRVAGYPFLGLFYYLFPDGRWVPAWTRLPALLGALSLAVWTFGTGGAMDAPGRLLLIALILGGILAQMYRAIYVSDRLQRQQTKWVLAGVIVALGSCTLGNGQSGWFYYAPASFEFLVIQPVLMLGMLAIPLSVGAAILQYRLWDLDRLIKQALVYGILSVFVVGVYMLLREFVAALPPPGPAAIVFAPLATGLILLVFQPLHERVQRGVNQLMYRERDEPYAVLSRLGQQLEAVVDTATMLPTIVKTVAEALQLPYVELLVKQGQDQQLHLAAAYGTRPGLSPSSSRDLLAFPLVYVHETVGELRVAQRAPGGALTPTDLALLTNLAQQAGAATHTVQITGELQRSLQRMVNAREEARRQLGSDLHDGLSHRLAGLLREAETASNLLNDNPSDTASTWLLLGEMQGHARAAINEVRSLAHAMHPPELELLGLAGALRERARDYQQGAAGERLQVGLEAPEALCSLPAAVEAAAYYIALEALTNVTRHAGARHCRLRLHLVASGDGTGPGSAGSTGDGQLALELEVSDDGVGLDAPRGGGTPGGPEGLGLISMRERAMELGGTCIVEPLARGGTRVFARLPFPYPSA